MDSGGLTTIAIGWAVSVTTAVSTMVLGGKLRLSREVEAMAKTIGTHETTITALRAELKATIDQALASSVKQVELAQDLARTNAAERKELLALLAEARRKEAP